MAELLADIIDSLVPIILEKMVDQIHGTSFHCDELLAAIEALSSGEPVALPPTTLSKTMLRVGPLELDLIDRAAKRGDRSHRSATARSSIAQVHDATLIQTQSGRCTTGFLAFDAEQKGGTNY